jgi:hypothetical protein
MADDDIWNLTDGQRETALIFLYEDILFGINRYTARIATVQFADEMAWVARGLLDLEIWVVEMSYKSKTTVFWVAGEKGN